MAKEDWTCRNIMINLDSFQVKALDWTDLVPVGRARKEYGYHSLVVAQNDAVATSRVFI